MEYFVDGWVSCIVNAILLAIPICIISIPMILFMNWCDKK